MANDNIQGASLDGIFERLQNVPRYHPLEAETFADWSLEAGDIVTVSRDGKSYPSPVHTSTLKWNGQSEVVVNSTGNEERDPVAKVSKKKYNRGSGGIRNNMGIYSDVWDEDGHVHSVISQTASEIHAVVEDVYAQMVSGLALTSSSAALYVSDMYNQLSSGLALTSSSAAIYVRDMYNQLCAGLELTSSSAAIYVRDMYNQLCAGLALTSSTAAIYVTDIYNQLSAGLALTSSSAALYVRDMYNQLTSGLKLTSSSAALYVRDMYNQLTSGLKLTSSSAALYVSNLYKQMTAGLKMTASVITQYVSSSYDRMASGLYQTSSMLQGLIVDSYNQLTSGLTLTSSSVRMYVNGRTSRAYIVAEINKGGTSEVRIGADQVQITGRTTLNDVMVISDRRVQIQTDLRVVGNTMMESLTLRDGSSSASLSETDLAKLVGYTSSPTGAVVKAEINSSGQLVLTHMNGSVVTFSKAVSLSGSWNGTTYSVSATSGTITGTPPSTTVFLEIEPGGSVNPNTSIAAKIYEGAPNTQQGTVRTTTYMTLAEHTSGTNGPFVEVYTGNASSNTRKGYISTAATYNAGWDHGLTLRTLSGRDATTIEQPIKTLTYDQKWTVVETFVASNGSTFTDKYTIAAPASGGTLSATWANGTLRVASSTGSFTTQISSTLNITGSYANTRFEAHARSTDSLGNFQSRASVSGYLKENVNGASSTVSVVLDPNSTSAIAVISTQDTFEAGYTVTKSQLYSSNVSVTTDRGQRESAGGISYAGLAQYVRTGYIVFDISCHGTNRYYYVAINA